MTIRYLHASKYGNGATVAAEFERQMAAKGVTVEVQHIRDATPSALAPADLYVFSSPGRMGRPIGGMRRFLKKLRLPAGTRYALLTTEMAPKPDKRTGRMPTEEELARWQRVRPLMNAVLQGKGLVQVAEDKVHVCGLKGPLEEGWEDKVGAFASEIVRKVSEGPAGHSILPRRGHASTAMPTMTQARTPISHWPPDPRAPDLR